MQLWALGHAWIFRTIQERPVVRVIWGRPPPPVLNPATPGAQEHGSDDTTAAAAETVEYVQLYAAVAPHVVTVECVY
jgi:hypothetical protein